MAEQLNINLCGAAIKGSISGVKAALKADVNYLFWSDDPIPDPETNPSTALFMAAAAGHVDVVKLLLRKGASMLMRCTGDRFFPLHIAAIKGQTEVVEVLVHHGATVDTREGGGFTPLLYACINGRPDTVRRLIEFGARADLVFKPRKNFTATEEWESYIRAYDKNSDEAECFRLAREARDTRLLRCCNPKCNKPGYRSDLKLCAGCKLTRYCSRECQRQHWSGGHKTCCGQDDVYSRVMTCGWCRGVL